MSTPTKPLFTARFTLLNTSAYSANTIFNIFKPDLTAAKYVLYQTPSVRSYTAQYRLSKEGPFPDDEAKSVFETMYIMGPAKKETALAKDLTNDPYGVRPILEQRKPIITAITWNIGAPAGATPQQLGDLLWSIRKNRVMDPAKYTGLGFTPVVDTYQKAPLTLSPYPNKPPIPSALLPAPKPAPKPAPVVTPTPPLPPIPPPTPIPTGEALFGDWRLWAIGGGLAVLALFGLDDKKKDRAA